MTTVSFGLMFYNEEACIERCINSFSSVCNEFVAVDMGGSDGSLNIVKKYTDKIWNNNLNNDFASARNFLKSCCSMEWCLLVDPDEFLLEEQKLDLKELVQSLDYENSRYDAIRLPRINWANLEQTEQMKVTGVKDYQYKLFRNIQNIKYCNKVHEVLIGCRAVLNYPKLPTQHNQFFKTENRRIHQNTLYHTIK